jgi:hypothetical protein
MIRKPLKTVLMCLLLLMAMGLAAGPVQAQLPAYFSWAKYYDTVLQDTVNYVTPVRHNQMSNGQCTVMAGAAAMESEIIHRLNKPDSNVDLSEQVAIACWPGSAGCTAYFTNFRPYATSVLTGVPTEACFPYDTPYPCDTQPDCDDTCDFPWAWASIIDDFTKPLKDCTLSCPGTSENIYYFSEDSLKSIIMNNGPVAVRLITDVYEHMTWGNGEDRYRGPWDQPDTWACNDGNHWVLIYGWDDECNDFDSSWVDTFGSVEVWLAKNSYGPDWGDQGPSGHGENSGCFKLAMDVPQFRAGIQVAEWTPLAKPIIYGPTDYSEYTVNGRVFPPDTMIRFTWGPPSGEPTDSLSYRLNIVDEGGNLVCSEETTGTTYVLSHVSVPTTYSWYVRAFIEGRASEKVSDWAGSDAVEILDQPCCDLLGDFNHDGIVDTVDYNSLYSYMFDDGFYPGCWEEANVNGIGGIDIADAVYLADYLFQSGPPPPACPK